MLRRKKELRSFLFMVFNLGMAYDERSLFEKLPQ